MKPEEETLTPQNPPELQQADSMINGQEENRDNINAIEQIKVDPDPQGWLQKSKVVHVWPFGSNRSETDRQRLLDFQMF